MPSQLAFREHQIPIDAYLEQSTRSLDQLHLDSIDLLSQFSFQTGSSRQVVSNTAVLDSYAHRSPRASGYEDEKPLAR
jgi:hypothetical protein